MSKKRYELIFQNDTIQLSKGPDGFWLHDATRGMNLAMRATSEQQAFVNAIMYYQRRLMKIEIEHKSLRGLVDNFVEHFNHVDNHE